MRAAHPSGSWRGAAAHGLYGARRTWASTATSRRTRWRRRSSTSRLWSLLSTCGARCTSRRCGAEPHPTRCRRTGGPSVSRRKRLWDAEVQGRLPAALSKRPGWAMAGGGVDAEIVGEEAGAEGGQWLGMWPILDPAALGAGKAVGDAPSFQAVVEVTSRGARGGEGTRHRPSATGVRFMLATSCCGAEGLWRGSSGWHAARCAGARACP